MIVALARFLVFLKLSKHAVSDFASLDNKNFMTISVDQSWWSEFVHDSTADLANDDDNAYTLRWVSLFASELKYCLKQANNLYLDATRCHDDVITEMMHVLVPNTEKVTFIKFWSFPRIPPHIESFFCSLMCITCFYA